MTFLTIIITCFCLKVAKLESLCPTTLGQMTYFLGTQETTKTEGDGNSYPEIFF